MKLANSLQSIHGDKVDISDPLLGCCVAMLINLPHDGTHVHGLGHYLMIVWYLIEMCNNKKH